MAAATSRRSWRSLQCRGSRPRDLRPLRPHSRDQFLIASPALAERDQLPDLCALAFAGQTLEVDAHGEAKRFDLIQAEDLVHLAVQVNQLGL